MPSQTHGSFNNVSTGGTERAAIYIARPQTSAKASRTLVKTFNAVADSPAPKLIGQVSNKERFEKPLEGWSEDFQFQDVAVKAHGTGFYIPPEYEQFLPEIQTMIDHYHKLHDDDGGCIMSIRQGVVEPKNGEKFVDVHKDLNLSRVQSGEGAPDSFVMIASNDLTTGFSGYTLPDEDVEKLEQANDPDAVFADILKQSDIRFETFAPGSITTHSAGAIHAIQNPDKPTYRTAVILVFHPESEPLPDNLNNPWLEEVLDAKTPLATKDNFVRKNI